MVEVLCILIVGLLGMLIGMIIDETIKNATPKEEEQPVEQNITIIELSKDHIKQPGEPVIKPHDNYFEPF